MGRSRIRASAAVAIVNLVSLTAFAIAAEPTVPLELPSEFAVVLTASVAAAPDTNLGTSPAPDSTGAPPAPADVRNLGIGARAKRAAGNFIYDGWVIATSPFRLRGRGFLWAGGIVATGAVMYANDQEILDAVVRNRDEPVFKAVVEVGNWIEPVGFMGRTNPIYLGLLAAGYGFNIRVLRTIPTEILESHLLAGGVRNLGKAIAGRQHPYDKEGPHKFEFGKGTSFPSGHTSVGFELATILSMNARSLPVTFAAYSLATALAVQRIESLNHWPSDVFIAATYGTLVARTVVRLHEERQKNRAQGISILPDFSDDGRPVGVRLTRAF